MAMNGGAEEAEFHHEGEMVAVGWLVAHAVVGAARAVATVALLVFEQELRGMDDRLFHLIIYMRAGEDMVDTLPLALIAVGAFDVVLTPPAISHSPRPCSSVFLS